MTTGSRGAWRARASARLAILIVLLAAPTDVAAGNGEDPGGLLRFPLESGNVWVYVKDGPGFPSTWRVAVAETVVRDDGQREFNLEGYFPGDVRVVRCYPLAGIVCDVDSTDGEEGLWYRLGGQVGDAWIVGFAGDEPDCLDGAFAQIASIDETITVPAGRFDDVVRVDYRSPCADAGLVSEWFAPGVGLVRRTELSFAGPVVSELVQARLGALLLPGLPCSLTLSIDGPVQLAARDAPTAMTLALALRNATGEPQRLEFAGCVSATIRVLDERGATAAEGRADDGGCCLCKSIVGVDLERGELTLATELTLADRSGRALADGRYSVVVTLETLGPKALRPSVSAPIEIRSER